MQDASPATYRTRSPAADSLRLTERLSARTLLLGGVLIVILSLFIGAEQDPDFWWHLRIGQWMAENGRLPSTDIFTFTAANHVWTDHEYLTEILMWLTFNTLGLATLVILFGLLTWAGFWLIYLQVRRQPFVFIGMGLAIGAIAGTPIWGPRAQMITFALSCLELYWLRGYLSGRSRAIMWFPLVMIAWANLHGGWVIGFVWLGVALAAELLSWALDQDNPEHKMHARRLVVIGLASLVAVAATPHFLSLYPYPFETQGSEAQQRLIVEWASPNFHNIELRPFELMIFLLVIGFALKRPSLFDLLLTLLAIGLALQNVRNIALFVAATTPVLINTYSGWWTEYTASRNWKYSIPPRNHLGPGRELDQSRPPGAAHGLELPGRRRRLAGGAPQRRHAHVQPVRLRGLPRVPLLPGPEPEGVHLRRGGVDGRQPAQRVRRCLLRALQLEAGAGQVRRGLRGREQRGPSPQPPGDPARLDAGL